MGCEVWGVGRDPIELRRPLLLLERLLHHQVVVVDLSLHLRLHLRRDAAARPAAAAAAARRLRGERGLELLDLGLELAHLGHRLVLPRLQLDRLRAVGVLQRVERLLVVVGRGRDRREHHRHAVAA